MKKSIISEAMQKKINFKVVGHDLYEAKSLS